MVAVLITLKVLFGVQVLIVLLGVQVLIVLLEVQVGGTRPRTCRLPLVSRVIKVGVLHALALLRRGEEVLVSLLAFPQVLPVGVGVPLLAGAALGIDNGDWLRIALSCAHRLAA